ncbi:MAG: hypothetical protein AB7D27_13085 [Desulfomicrobium sp.]
MAYKATVLPVMIASPGDVSEERRIIRSVIHEWNDVNAFYSKIILAPVCWETHSSPELGVRPQELINSRLLKDCDLLIGVFWTRLGTPTGEADSGTVEEIERHLQEGKPAMLYFSSKPVAPDNIDAAQYEKVKRFKQISYASGLVESFENTDDFERKLRNQLQITLNSNPYIQSIIKNNNVDENENLSFATQSNVSLSNEAKELLIAAAGDQHGNILKIAAFGGKTISAAGKGFGDSSARESAKWEEALDELIRNDLVVGRGLKGEVFELTHKGWEMADSLKSQDSSIHQHETE